MFLDIEPLSIVEKQKKTLRNVILLKVIAFLNSLYEEFIAEET